MIVDMMFNLQMDGESKYAFQDFDICITNPFLYYTGRFSVNPVEEYGEKFVNSNYMILLDKIKNYLGPEPTQERKNLCIHINIEGVK